MCMRVEEEEEEVYAPGTRTNVSRARKPDSVIVPFLRRHEDSHFFGQQGVREIHHVSAKIISYLYLPGARLYHEAEPVWDGLRDLHFARTRSRREFDPLCIYGRTIQAEKNESGAPALV